MTLSDLLANNPVLYMSLHNCVNLSIGPLSNVFSISATIKSVSVALLFVNFLMACFTSVDVIEGPLSSLISGLITLSLAYSYPMYAIQTFTSASFLKHNHVVMFVHDPRCLGSLSTIRYPPELYMHLPC